ncbi:SDR family NAD(P)-dependent oxidoreductase [Dactylosporangium sp. AC04546]|uniref:SDR family NAD(P)-dependent oxidoreductase n=1 Tax=Dactylosporangium sp. AC04546 TaxID=2862460 RepID=UPI002E7C3619|nr:SDR family NAD(P)-dependent oxidoreductase [Dactylosporangium sp. AC04546]WVK81151.1 SDR family NAD(P)-dependent oxidoreductase [Dactylosporangium sp. AC04546]
MVVTGASRGFGRVVAAAFTGRRVRVVGIARTAATLDRAAAQLGDAFVSEPGDAADPALARRILAEHRPDVVVLCAGAQPPAGPFHELGWAEFARNREVDVRQAYECAPPRYGAPRSSRTRGGGDRGDAPVPHRGPGR